MEWFARQFNVSRETMGRLRSYVDLLDKWNRRINLVGAASASEIWSRHISDCAQIVNLAPERAKTWYDIGSGAGLPGIVIAILWRESNPAGRVTLVDSDGRKIAFLTEVARALVLNTDIVCDRIEHLTLEPPDIVSARALAPLDKLLTLCAPLAGEHTTLLLHKGRNVHDELTQARKYWHIDAETVPSLVDQESTILKIGRFQRT